MIIDGQKTAQLILKKLKLETAKLKYRIGLGVILIGKNPASLKYVAIKKNKCREFNFFFKEVHFSAKIEEPKVYAAITKMNRDSRIDGIVVQLPLPKKFNQINVLSRISPDKDAEGLNPLNFSKLIMDKNVLSVVPRAIMNLLETYKIKIDGKFILIINHSYLIGKPLAYLLLNKGANVAICHRNNNLQGLCKMADIIICAVGQPRFLKAEMVKKGVIVFDMGFSLINHKVVGDADFEKLKKKCRYITPTPGGVGPVTVAMLLNNVYTLAKKRRRG